MSKLSKERLTKLFNEIKMAEAYNEEEIQPIVRESVSRYTGKYYPNLGRNWQVLINEFYPIIQFNLPSTFLYTPKAFLKPKHKFYITKRMNPVTGKKEDTQIQSADSARTQEAIINYNLQEMDYKEEVRKVVLDALLFPHAVIWHGYKGDFGMTEEDELFIREEKTFAKHINPLEFLKDPCVGFTEVQKGKWVGRIIDIPLQDLLEDDKLDVDKSRIRGFKGYGTQVGTKTRQDNGGMDRAPLASDYSSLLTKSDKEFQNSAACRFVRCYEIIVKPTKKEKRQGKKGKILLLTHEQSKPLREDDWTVKAEGFPSELLQFNPVPNSMLSLADIDTYKASVDHKNAIYNLQLRNATENSKVWVMVAKENIDGEDAIEKIENGDQTIIMINDDNVSNKMQLMSPSGMASSELYLIDQRIQKNIENISGVTDLKRGFLQSGEESATSVRIRTAGGAARPAYRQDIMSDFLKKSIHYLLQLEKQFTTVKEAVRIMGTLDLQWSDNPSKEEIQADVDVDIDVISMLPEDPERELRNLQQTLSYFTQAIQSPAVMAKIGQEGKTINLTPLINQILNRMKLKDPDIYRDIKPQEAGGFASMQQLQEAQQNIVSTVAQGQIAIPPKEGDDHRVKLMMYTMIQQLLEASGQQNQALQQLIILQQSEIEKLQAKQGGNEVPINIDQAKPNIRAV